VKLIYRASRAEDIVFFSELDQLSRSPDATVAYVIGRRGQALPQNPLDASALRGLVPDIETRDVFMCGPASMMDAVERSLRELGVPRRRVHTERFAA
jgi:ferredoxin-NADP reductase